MFKFKFKVNGVLDIGNNNIKMVVYKNKKIDKVEIVNYENTIDEKIILLQESLEKLNKKTSLKGKNFIVTIPSSKFNVKILEYETSSEDVIKGKIQEDLEDLIIDYTTEDFITHIETISEKDGKTKKMVIAIPIMEVEQVLGILKTFKVRVLKLMPDFISLNNLVQISQANVEVETAKNIMVIDIGGETTKTFVTSSGVINLYRMIGVAGNDVTELIKDNIMLEHGPAETKKQDLEVEISDDGEQIRFSTQAEVSLHKELKFLIEDLTNQIKNTYTYFNNNLKDGNIDKIIITGGGSLLINLNEYFNKHFEIPFETISLNDFNIAYKNVEDQEKIKDAQLTTIFGALLTEVV